MVNRLNLNQRLDSAAAERLRDDLSGAEGDDLALDASGVEVLGGLCLELLMCAGQVWAAAGRTFSIENPSPDFADNLARFGLSPETLSTGARP